MRTYKFLALSIFLVCISACSKQDDERDLVVGTYSGICVVSYWVDTIIGFKKDTLPGPSLFYIRKSIEEQTVIFSCAQFSQEFPFSYSNGQFTSLTNYHPPTLRIHSDSLYLYYKPVLGPYWTECFGFKK